MPFIPPSNALTGTQGVGRAGGFVPGPPRQRSPRTLYRQRVDRVRADVQPGQGHQGPPWRRRGLQVDDDRGKSRHRGEQSSWSCTGIFAFYIGVVPFSTVAVGCGALMRRQNSLDWDLDVGKQLFSFVFFVQCVSFFFIIFLFFLSSLFSHPSFFHPFFLFRWCAVVHPPMHLSDSFFVSCVEKFINISVFLLFRSAITSSAKSTGV